MNLFEDEPTIREVDTPDGDGAIALSINGESPAGGFDRQGNLVLRDTKRPHKTATFEPDAAIMLAEAFRRGLWLDEGRRSITKNPIHRRVPLV